MSDIEKADEIVGIKEILGPGGALDYTAKATKDTHRRGAYVGWLPKQNGFSGMFGPSASAPLEHLAAEIVRLHKPKGDGLPENLVAWCSCMNGCECVRVALEDEKSMPFNVQVATREYIHRCLTAPVRRLLAAFDVFEPDGGVLVNGSYMIEKPGTGALCPPTICRLIPRAAR